MRPKRVLSLGQCGADHYGISRLLQAEFGAEVVGVDTTREALDHLGRQHYDLVLVNRLLNSGGSGLDFIQRQMTGESPSAVPVMLVSDRDDAQRQAVANGALLGFGKAALTDATTLQRLGIVLGRDDGQVDDTQRNVESSPRSAARPG